MSNIYLFKYNNFYNRLVKREEAIESYGVPLFVLENANFNPNDGVTAQHVINYVTLPGTPDYAVVTDEGGAISSRWFVMECRRTRGLQYRLNLLRDVMAEYRNEIMNATAFIEKGYVKKNNPLIFNNENMGFNQIKNGEYLLENNLKTPWLILYLSRYNGEGQYNSFEGNFRLEESDVDVDYILDSLDNYKFNYWANEFYITSARDDIIFMAEYTGPDTYDKNYYANILAGVYPNLQLYGINANGKQERTKRLLAYKYTGGMSSMQPNAILYTPNFSQIENKYNQGITLQGGLPYNTYSRLGTDAGIEELLAENGKKIKVGNKIYRIEISDDYFPIHPGFPTPSDPWYLEEHNISPSSELGIELKKIFANSYFQSTTSTTFNFKILYKRRRVLTIKYLEYGESNLFYNFSYDRAITSDSVYEIVAAPLYDITFSNVPGVAGGGTVKSIGSIARAWFQNIVNKYNAEGAAYDLQVVPYCPIDSTDLSKENVIFCYYTETNVNTGINNAVGIKLRNASFTKRITLNGIPFRNDIKLSNEVDIYRICSPNGVGEYEWSPAKNGATVGEFEIDCTLIPFNPYIKINPVFCNLYGNDYDDFRGLICGGDFSMPILNNAWETYQLSNKNYQDIFNRDIAHQEFNNKISRIQEGVGIATQTMGAGMQGFQSGGGAGAGVAALTSLAGGVADFAINESSRRENIQYQKDRFGYELGTIKARSQSLTRSSSININNKYFPYVEYYSCTSVEIEAFQNKIKYNGMTVEVIGRIKDYLDKKAEWTYIQGELIFLDIPEDYQIVEEINRNLRGGVRIVYPK